jgi:outer membrane protein assembly factor BamB
MVRRLMALVVLGVCVSAGSDWPRFRGPNGDGSASEKGAPEKWGAQENLLWKTQLPGAGSSSPTTWGSKIFLTSYSGYGLSEDEPGEPANLELHVLGLDRAAGKIVWNNTVKPEASAGEYRGFVTMHGFASSTPATDGQAVYVFLGRSGVYAYSLEGQPLWHTEVGSKLHPWGSASSPVLAGKLVIVNASVESGSLVALDKASGKEVWRVAGMDQSWSTPALVDLPGGGQELVVSVKGKVLGFDPASGAELWHCVGVDDYVCAAVIAHQGIVYVTGGRKPPTTLAIRAGGRGDVTASHRLWQVKKGSKVGTPLLHDGYLYWIAFNGSAECLKADTGETVYEEKLEIAGRGDKVYASLVYADGKLYGVTRQDGTVVLTAGPKFDELERNHLGDKSIFNATPAASDGQLLLRSDRFLYLIGNK